MQPDTHTDWRNLPAGPELDALVAERVLGMRACTWTGAPAPTYPRCSTDLGAMWQVVEAMERRGWEWSQSKENGRYSCDFHHPERNLWPDTVWADTAPLAICRAALAALEVEP